MTARLQLAAVALIALAATSLVACGGRSGSISGTKIPDNQINRDVLAVVESYRVAVEEGDAAGLVLMASPSYWEDSGTPSGSDDYGIDGLKEVLAGRFRMVSEIRYSMKYVNIRRACPNADGNALEVGCRARVEVLIDASFSVADARGQQRRPDKRDQNELVLEWNGEKWLFLSGM